ncbi:MAG: hypothetical protein R3E09_03620 [Novosphingobium sp.]
MSRSHSSFLLPPLLALTLTACASSGEYPSLARRDAERITGAAQPVAPQTPLPELGAPPSAQLDARLDNLIERADAAHQRFIAARPRTEQLVAAARGAAVASESWSVASIALADLGTQRSDAMIALAELDQLYAAERIDHFETESRVAVAIGAARDKVSTLVAEEEGVLATLGSQMPQGKASLAK